jgi:hypothetical protein
LSEQDIALGEYSSGSNEINKLRKRESTQKTNKLHTGQENLLLNAHHTIRQRLIITIINLFYPSEAEALVVGEE